MSRILAVAALAAALTSGSALAASPLVDAEWLKSNLGADGVVVLDLREPAKEGEPDPFLAGRIPGAVPAPYARSGWRVEVGGVPGMLPSEAEVEALLGRLGIEADDHVVLVSDGASSSDFGAAARVYWTLKVMGHAERSVLEGGHAAWVAAGGELETGPAAAVTTTSYDATFDSTQLATLDDVKAAQAAGATLVDARPARQFTGEETPANVGVAGTLAGAVSLPHDTLVIEGRDVVDAEVLGSLRADAGIADQGDHVAFCNTGHWAAVGWFLLSEVGGNEEVRLYDGSMVEWAKNAGLPTVTSAVQ